MPRRKTQKIDASVAWMKALNEVMRTIPEDRQMVVLVEHEDGSIGGNSTCCDVCALRIVETVAALMARDMTCDDCETQASVH